MLSKGKKLSIMGKTFAIVFPADSMDGSKRAKISYPMIFMRLKIRLKRWQAKCIARFLQNTAIHPG